MAELSKDQPEGSESEPELSSAENAEFFRLLEWRDTFKKWMVGINGILEPMADDPADQEQVNRENDRYEELRQRIIRSPHVANIPIAETRPNFYYPDNFDEPFDYEFVSGDINTGGRTRCVHCSPEKREVIERNGRKYTIFAIPAKDFAPGFGIAFCHPEKPFACVREDLPRSVYEWVREHELYHLMDTHTWGGVFGSEFRANAYATWQKPFGLFAAIMQGLKEGRVKRYLKYMFGIEEYK